MFAKFQKQFKDLMAGSVEKDEVARDEPPQLDLSCLQIQLFLFLACLDKVQEKLAIVLPPVSASAPASAKC